MHDRMGGARTNVPTARRVLVGQTLRQLRQDVSEGRRHVCEPALRGPAELASKAVAAHAAQRKCVNCIARIKVESHRRGRLERDRLSCGFEVGEPL